MSPKNGLIDKIAENDYRFVAVAVGESGIPCGSVVLTINSLNWSKP